MLVMLVTLRVLLVVVFGSGDAATRWWWWWSLNNYMVGARNTVLIDALSRRIPLVSDLPTIILGADVTHLTKDRIQAPPSPLLWHHKIDLRRWSVLVSCVLKPIAKSWFRTVAWGDEVLQNPVRELWREAWLSIFLACCVSASLSSQFIFLVWTWTAYSTFFLANFLIFSWTRELFICCRRETGQKPQYNWICK